MARKRRPQQPPEPLPAATRTVGQLVADAARLYQGNFWRALSLGVLPAGLGTALPLLPVRPRVLVALLGGPLALTAAYVAATVLATGARPGRRELAVAFTGGVAALVPVAVVVSFATIAWLPSILWLALVGLVVPVALVERKGFQDSFSRAVALARADYVHAAGSLATLAIIALLTSLMLFLLLVDQGEATQAAGGFLAVLVISPLVFLGSALLYDDQVARTVGSRRPKRRGRRRDADLHHVDHADRSRAPDAEVEPGAAARGQP